MRVALFDISPYAIGGDRTWCTNVRYGLETDGHQVTYLRANLLASAPDCKKFTGLPDLLGYDAVIFSDVYADRRSTEINLIGLLLELRRRDVMTIVGLHGNLGQQPDRGRLNEAVHALKLASHPWTTNPAMTLGYIVDIHRFRVMPFLPYRPRIFPNWPDWSDKDWEAQRGLLITGRLSAPKGQRVLVNLADQIGVPLTIAGKTQFAIAKTLLEDVLKGGGRLIGDEPRGYGMPWAAETKNGVPVRYTGGYRDAIDEVPWTSATVHVNLTAKDCSIGHLEYSSLEAMDAGLRVATPFHVRAAHPEYHSVFGLDHQGYMSHRDYLKSERETTSYLATQLADLAMRQPTSKDEVAIDLGYHDPVRYARDLVATD